MIPLSDFHYETITNIMYKITQEVHKLFTDKFYCRYNNTITMLLGFYYMLKHYVLALNTVYNL